MTTKTPEQIAALIAEAIESDRAQREVVPEGAVRVTIYPGNAQETIEWLCELFNIEQESY